MAAEIFTVESILELDTYHRTEEILAAERGALLKSLSAMVGYAIDIAGSPIWARGKHPDFKGAERNVTVPSRGERVIMNGTLLRVAHLEGLLEVGLDTPEVLTGLGLPGEIHSYVFPYNAVSYVATRNEIQTGFMQGHLEV